MSAAEYTAPRMGNLSDKPELMNTADAADAFGVSEKTIRRWCETGEIPHTKVGRAFVFDRNLLRAWLDERFAQSMARTAKADGLEG